MTTLYKSFIWFLLSVAFIGLPLSFLAYGSDFQQQQSPLYPFQSSIIVQDEFLTGTSMIGWGSSGTVRAVTSVAGRIGLFQIDTTAVVNAFSAISLLGSTGSLLNTNLPLLAIHIAQLAQTDANTVARIGSFATTSIAPVRGMYFEKAAADTNWFCVLGNASVYTRVDSGIATDTSYHRFLYRSTGTSVQWSIDGVSVCGTMSTNFPVLDIAPGFQIQTTAAAIKLMNVDYFQMNYTGLTR